MKKGEIITGKIEEIKFPNKGILRTEEGICYVKNAIPGQEVEVRITKKKRGKAEGTVTQVLTPSPDERPVPCPKFGICGGCTYLSMTYESQLALKEQQVRKLLSDALTEYNHSKAKAEYQEKVGDIDWKCVVPPSPEELAIKEQKADLSWFEGILPSPREYGYRNKMEFSFGDEEKDGPLALGMHKRGSFYDIVNADPCTIVDHDYREIVSATRKFWNAKGTPFYHRLRHTGYLRHLLVRKASGTGEILIDLVTTTQEDHEADLIEYKDLLLGLDLEDQLVGILHTRNDAVADVIKDEGTDILYGKEYFTEVLLGLQFKVTPFSFFQTNSYGAEILYSTARKYLIEAGMKSGTLFDLYCGTGTIAQLMSSAAQKVIGVEIVEEAVEAAKQNAALNGIHNCDFIAGDVLKVIDEIEEKPDTIILDPPRDGVHPKALPKILQYGVNNILYISCKPTSLVRDLPAFLDAGYVPVRGTCVDQFPWTANVETIVLLSRKN